MFDPDDDPDWSKIKTYHIDILFFCAIVMIFNFCFINTDDIMMVNDASLVKRLIMNMITVMMEMMMMRMTMTTMMIMIIMTLIAIDFDHQH